jgi:hypothetical protein
MKYLILFATLLTLQAEIISWEAVTPNNPDEKIKQYHLFLSADGGASYQTHIIVHPLTNYTFAAAYGIQYRCHITTMNDSFIESIPSDTAYYTKPPKLPVPPAINITGRTIAQYNKTAGAWMGYTVTWDPINLAAYGATNYVLRMQADTSSSLHSTTNSFHQFPGLPVGNYVFSVTTTGSSGQSPAGKSLVQTSAPPKNPKIIIFQATD